MTDTEFNRRLACLVDCMTQKDPTIEHEWLFDTRVEAVRFANLLRAQGFKAETKSYFDNKAHYAGVPFSTLNDH